MKHNRLCVTVTDENGAPIAGATVYQNGVKPDKTKGLTDEQGIVFLNLMTKGIKSVSVEKEGFKSLKRIFYDNGQVLGVQLEPNQETVADPVGDKNSKESMGKEVEKNKVYQAIPMVSRNVKRSEIDWFNIILIAIGVITALIVLYLLLSMVKSGKPSNTDGLPINQPSVKQSVQQATNHPLNSGITPVETSVSSVKPTIIPV